MRKATFRDVVEDYRDHLSFPYGESSDSDRPFEHCCGVTEIGGFGEPDELLEDLQGAYADDQEYDKEDRSLAQPTQSLVVALVKDYIEGLVESHMAYVATTVASQTHAIQALRQLGFQPTKVTRRVTLWVKRAQGVRS